MDLHSVSQVDGVSDMALPYQLCAGRVEQRGSDFCPEWQLLDGRHFSFSLYTTGAFQAATLVLELRGSKSE